MSEENNIQHPQRLNIESFPKEIKSSRRKRSKGPRFYRRAKRRYKAWKEERAWRKRQKRKSRYTFRERLLIFLLTPIADFINDIKEQRAYNKKRKRPSFFKRLYLIYKEERALAKETRKQDRRVRRSLSFIAEENKRVYSLREQIKHMHDTWNNLPWNKTREFENMLAATMVIIFSFSINYLLLQLSKFITAHFFDIPTYWGKGKILFNIPDASDLWTYSSVISIYISGPIILLISGILFLNLHYKTKDKGSFKALSFLWLYITAFLLFFGTFIAGIFTNRGFGYVMGWLFIPRYIEIPFGVFSLFMLWMIGYSAGKKFISLTPGYTFYSGVLPQLYIKLLYIYIPTFISIFILFLIGFNSRDFTIQIVYILLIALLTPTLRFIPEKMK